MVLPISIGCFARRASGAAAQGTPGDPVGDMTTLQLFDLSGNDQAYTGTVAPGNDGCKRVAFSAMHVRFVPPAADLGLAKIVR